MLNYKNICRGMLGAARQLMWVEFKNIRNLFRPVWDGTFSMVY